MNRRPTIRQEVLEVARLDVMALLVVLFCLDVLSTGLTGWVFVLGIFFLLWRLHVDDRVVKAAQRRR